MAQGALRCSRHSRRNGLTLEQLTGPGMQRLPRIQQLLADARLDDELRWQPRWRRASRCDDPMPALQRRHPHLQPLGSPRARPSQSVLAQTLDDLEVVVSDNQSTDDTRDVIAEFDDPRVRYVAPPEHLVLPDSWEFARQAGDGDLIMELSDDDALVTTALRDFVDANRRFDADFLLCQMAEYRDQAFPPDEGEHARGPFVHRVRRGSMDRDVFIRRPHDVPARSSTPTRAATCSSASSRTRSPRRNDGRFFQTLGVEYFAWPVAAGAVARNVVHIDLPLVVIGRTAKSWGTNMVLTNPGPQKIDQFLSDAVTTRKYTPLTNFTFNNLAIEGLLTAKAAFPDELAPYPLDYRGLRARRLGRSSSDARRWRRRLGRARRARRLRRREPRTRDRAAGARAARFPLADRPDRRATPPHQRRSAVQVFG